MPSYDFKCRDCGKVFEGRKRMSDPCPPCAACGGETQVSFAGGAAGAVQFKGGGCAADGYASVSKPLTVNQMLDRNS